VQFSFLGSQKSSNQPAIANRVATEQFPYTQKRECYTFGEWRMRTNIDIDDGLMRRAMRLGGIDTTKAMVEAALRLFIQTRAQVGMRRFRGKVKWEGNLKESRLGRNPEESNGDR
jgi:Arc/MetJ family transcription regulator